MIEQCMQLAMLSHPSSVTSFFNIVVLYTCRVSSGLMPESSRKKFHVHFSSPRMRGAWSTHLNIHDLITVSLTVEC